MKFFIILFSMTLFFSSKVIGETNNGFDDIIVFGGIFNDTGNYAALNGNLDDIYWNNRFTNGPVLAEHMAESLHLPLRPSLHVIGDSQGNNYSLTSAWAASKEDDHHLGEMLDAYFHTTNGKASQDTLYFLWVGGHDVVNAVLTGDDINYQALDDAVSGTEDALYRLIDNGAQHIFAPTYADIGFSPFFISVGLPSKMTTASQYYNRKFRRMLRRVEHHTRQRIYKFDFDNYIDHLYKNHAYMGFNNITDACLENTEDGDCSGFIFYNTRQVTTRTFNTIADAFTQDLLSQVDNCDAGNWHPKANWRHCADIDWNERRNNHGVPYSFYGQ